MIPMNARTLTQISLAALLVGGLGACTKAGHGHSLRYGGDAHAGHYGAHQSSSAWDMQGWDAGSAWQTAEGPAYGTPQPHAGPYGSQYPRSQYPGATYTGGPVMPAPAPIPGPPPIRSRYGTTTGPNGDTCCIVPQIVYVDRIQTVEVEKIVEKPVERIVEVEKIVEKIVEVEKPIYIEVEKPGYQPPPLPPRPKSRK